MNTFRGAPAIFGGPSCDPNTEMCLNDKIQMYDVDNDDWMEFGKLIYPRRFAAVVEVPAEFCDTFIEPLPPTTTTASATSTSYAKLIMFLMSLIYYAFK